MDLTPQQVDRQKRNKDYYEKNKDSKSNYAREYYKRNREQILARSKEQRAEKNGGESVMGRPRKNGMNKVVYEDDLPKPIEP